MLNNITNFFNLISARKVKVTTDSTDLLPLGTRDPRYNGLYQPTAILACDFANQIASCGIVQCGTGIDSLRRINVFNTASGCYSTAFGKCNTASGNGTFVGGGNDNTTTGLFSGIVSGSGNCTCTNSNHSFVGGGSSNISYGHHSAVLGGTGNNTNNNNCTMIVGSNIIAN